MRVATRLATRGAVVGVGAGVQMQLRFARHPRCRPAARRSFTRQRAEWRRMVSMDSEALWASRTGRPPAVRASATARGSILK